MRRPQLSASDSDHSGEVAAPDGEPEASDGEDEPDVAELIEQVGREGADNEAAEPTGDDDGAIRCSRPTSNSKCVPRAGHDAAGC